MKRIILLSLVSFLFFTLSAQVKDNCFRVGLNYGMPTYYGSNGPFINLFTQTQPFSSEGQIPADTNGYPLEVPYGGITEVRTLFNSGESTVKDDSIYVIQWDGDGDIDFDFWQIGSSVFTKHVDTANRIEFSMDWDPDPMIVKHIILKITRSNPADHLRNIRIYHDDYEDLYENQGEKWDPRYLSILSSFNTLRTMPAFNTNGGQGFTEWSDRTTPTWYNQHKGQTGAGLAYEHAIDLCNKLQAHMWFNVPHLADDEAIRKMAEMVYAQLDPDLDVYLEYSNEVWNWAPAYWPQSNYAQIYGQLHYGGGIQEGYAALSKNIFRIWREVFGKDSLKVKRVCAIQTLSDMNHNAIPRINAMGAENFDVLSPTYYFPGMKTSYCDIDAAFDDMQASIRGGNWYETRKLNIELAKAYDKEVFFYEGGLGADPEDAGDYSCLSIVQQMQTHPRMYDVIKEGLDTLAALGAEGGNELALWGNWEVNLVNNQIGFWGNIKDVDSDPADYPKFNAYANSFSDCDNLIKSTNEIGAGNAIRLDGVNDYVDITTAYRPNDAADNYTIDLWVKAEKLGFDQYIWSMSYAANEASNSLYIGANNRFVWNVKNNAGASVANVQGPLVELNKWYHVSAVKANGAYTLYVNGSEKASAQGNITGVFTKSKFIIGGKAHSVSITDNFCGTIDEFRLWRAGITNQNTQRDWMCKKTTASHPNYANLMAYYRFDEVDLGGAVKDQFGVENAVIKNMKFSKYSNYFLSGAPVGDNSVQTYPPSWDGVSHTYYHSNGDRFTVSSLGDGNPEGIHIYLVNEEPYDIQTPSDSYIKIGTYYYGVFVANGTNPHYTAIYNYSGNPDAAVVDESNRLLKRSDNYDLNGWQNTGGQLNVFAKTITTRLNRESSRGEYIIGQRPNLVQDLSGPGYSLRFPGADEEAIINFERPDDEYTLSFWYHAENSSGHLVTFKGPGYANFTRVSYWARGRLKFEADKGWDPAFNQQNLILDQTGWNHVAVVKKNDFVNIYLNGRLVTKQLLMGYNSNGVKRDQGFKQIILGGSGFDGWLDEFQIWDIAMDSTTIREWMCREISDSHPQEAEHLLLYYNFDEGSGNELENARGAGDMILSGTTWDISGCPVGDTSIYHYEYTSTNNYTVSIPHTNGDYLEIEKTGGETYGVHLYRVDGKAQFSNIPGGINSWDSTRYWGVYPISVGYTGARKYNYDARYYYNGNENVDMSEEANLRLLDRMNNNDADWNLNVDPPELTSHFFDESYVTADTTNQPFWHPYMSHPHEFILGATTATAIVVDTARPPQPGAIVGLATVCSGEIGVTYSVPANPDPGVFYVWTLPVGMSGYSDSNSISVNISPTADGLLGDIVVSAVNKNGLSDPQSQAITAVLTASLSVSINGPAEICADETATYAITDVGATSYNWEVPGDAIIVSNTGTSIEVDFGSESGNVTVYGVYPCGTALINTKPITVNIAPDITLGVSGNRICSGEYTHGRITISNSQLGMEYQCYKNFGTSPIGDPLYGTGYNLVIEVPITELLAGDNSITVKAQMGNCPEVTLTQTGTVTVDVPPDANMPLFALQDTICKGQDAIVYTPNAPAGTHFLPSNDYDWTVDSDPPYVVNPGYITEGGYTEIPVPPCSYNGQMSNVGIAMGANRITMEATVGTCKTVKLNTTVKVFVKNDPHTMDFTDNGLDWWIKGGNVGPWVNPPDSLDYIQTDISENNICNTDFVFVSVNHSQKDVAYYLVYDYDGTALSDTVVSTYDGQELVLSFYKSTLPEGTDLRVNLMAQGSDCEVLVKRFTVDVIAGPDIDKTLVGSTICGADDGTVTVVNSQNNITYQAVLLGGSTAGTPVVGDGGDIVLTIPSILIGGADKQVYVRATRSGCTFPRILNDTVDIKIVGGLDATAQLVPDYASVCGGTDAVFTVIGAQEGATYQTYANGTLIGPAVIAPDDTTILIIPDADIQAAYTDETVNITVQVMAGSCASTFLTDNENLYVNSYTYPTGTLSVNERNTIPVCYWTNDTLWMGLSQALYNSINGVDYMSVIVNGEPASVLTPTKASGEIEVAITKDEMPWGDRYGLSFYAHTTGCPPKEIRDLGGHGGDVLTNARVFEEYHFETITGDTVCVGDIATVQVLNMDTNYFGMGYRLYDKINDRAMSISFHTKFDADDYPNYYPWQEHLLRMNISNADDLLPGVNSLILQADAGGNTNCGWEDIPGSDVDIVVNEPPLTGLTVTGGSQCAGDGLVTISGSEADVIYEAFMGTKSVGVRTQGNGGDIDIVIPQAELSPGANNVTIKATRNECNTVDLDYIALIEVTAAPPAKPATITGETVICANETGIQYSVPLDNQASSYTWTLPTGATTTSTSNIALVDYASSGGTLSVVANNICGASTASDALTITVYPEAIGGSITSAVPEVCIGGNTDLYLSGSSGEIRKWEYSSSPGIWTELFSTEDTVSTPALSDDTQFRALLEEGTCGVVYSALHTVTVNPIPTLSAGSDTTVEVCETETAVTLLNVMGGNPDAGGTWSDDNASGGLNVGTGVFNPSVVTSGMDYEFTYLQQVAGCASNDATLTVSVVGFPDAGADTAVVVCANTGELNLFEVLAGNPTTGGLWTNDIGGYVPEILDLNGMAEGTYVYTYSITTIAPCLVSTSAQVTVNVHVGPRTDIVVYDAPSCSGGDAKIAIEPSQTGIIYQPMMLDGTLFGDTITGDGYDMFVIVPTPVDMGESMQVFISAANEYCVVVLPDTALITAKPAPSPEISGDELVCPNSSVTYSIVGDDNNTYQWTVDTGSIVSGGTETEVIIQFEDFGNVQLIVEQIGLNKCSGYDTLFIEVGDDEAPVFTNCADVSLNADYENGVFIATITDDSYDMVGSDNCNINLVITNSVNNTATLAGESFTEDAVVTWTIVDGKGNAGVACSQTIEVVVNQDINPPTAFSPNGDGTNDFWEIDLLTQLYPKSSVKVFDKGGRLVFESEEGVPVSWDGTLNGIELPVDSYFFILEFGDDTNQTGIVTIIK